MEQKLPRMPRQTLPSHSKKNKKRFSRRSGNLQNLMDAWPNASQNDQDASLVTGVEYPPQMLWQSTNMPQNMPGNGQRLFTAMSDPSVCGYSPMPMTYTMQPVSLPTMYRMYQPMPVPNIRTIHNKQRHHYNKHLANVHSKANNNVVNGYENLQENGILESAVHIPLQNGDYTSLPPTANKDSGVNGDELNSEHRRYSDPGLGPAGNSDHTDSDNSDSVESGSSITTISRSNKLILSLIEQMTELKKCNSQLFKELSETKSNLENIKAKMAQYKHNTPADYQPGMLSELIRDIREANKSCGEGLITKVQSLLEEKYNQQAKEMDELKNQLAKLIKEKEESDQRVAKLEEEMTTLKLSTTNEDREIAVFEEENLALRRELQEARASRTQAENHAAKCVNFALSRSITPVNFNTPCITSTPVRTALTETRFLLPTPASHAPFSILSSHATKVAAFQPTYKVNQCQNYMTESEIVSYEDSKENMWKRVEMFLISHHANDDVIDFWSKIVNQNKKSKIIDPHAIYNTLSKIELGEYLGSFAKETRKVIGNDDEIKTIKEEEKVQISLIDIPEESIDDQLLKIRDMKTLSIIGKNGTKETEDQKDPSDKLTNDVASKPEKIIESYPDNFWQRLCKLRGNQRGSFKKSRCRKESLRKLFDDEPDEDQRNTKILADIVSPSCETNCNTMNEDGGSSFKDSRANRAITDVPDVVVIDGGSVIPEDLCSMRTLTSRTQTAPSRATYTTAYI